MNSKTIYYIAAFIGSLIGGYIPALWGAAGVLSLWSLSLGTVGAVMGVVLVWKFFNN